METVRFQVINCHFCGSQVIYPAEVDRAYLCVDCGSWYEACESADIGEELFDMAEVILGHEVCVIEEVHNAFEIFLECGVDYFYDNEEQAELSPEEGSEVVMIWFRPKARAD